MAKLAKLLANLFAFAMLVTLSIKVINFPVLNTNQSSLLIRFSDALGLSDHEMTYTVLFFIPHGIIALIMLFLIKKLYVLFKTRQKNAI